MKKIYLDNNATTFMPQEVLKEYVAWANKGNPSSSYATECKKKIAELKELVAKICNFSLDSFYVVITSGASESNAYILRGVIDGYKLSKPHIIASAIEHKSILMCLEGLESLGRVEYSLVQPDEYGFITLAAIEPLIKKNTALITIMAANNETGTINETAAISKLAHKYNIPFHSDYTQKFGKIPPTKEEQIDALSMSFHKIHGPPGIGALVMKKDFYKGMNICPLIFGTQNEGLRGGTENISAIAAAVAAMKYTFKGREQKNIILEEKKKFLIIDLAKKIDCISFSQYKKNITKPPLQIIFISGAGGRYLPNTLLISVLKFTGTPLCNIKLKKKIEDAGAIVSIGSACNTNSKEASHVIKALNVDDIVRRGILRISMCDNTTLEEIKKFNNILVSNIIE